MQKSNSKGPKTKKDENGILTITEPRGALFHFEKLGLMYTKKNLGLIGSYFEKFAYFEYSTIFEICQDVQNFMLLSKYNLKRNDMHNRSTVTFVCSCVSRKVYGYDENDEVEVNRAKKKTFGRIINLSLAKRRPVKRHNLGACRFRLKFKLDKVRGKFLFNQNSNLYHNHLPETNPTNKEFTNLYKNIKYPLELVIQVFQNIANNKDFLLYSSKKIKYKTELIQSFNLFTPEMTSRTKSDVAKKLNHFLSMVQGIYKRVSKDKKEKNSKVFLLMIRQFLKKSSGSYLRLEDNEKLYTAYKG